MTFKIKPVIPQPSRLPEIQSDKIKPNQILTHAKPPPHLGKHSTASSPSTPPVRSTTTTSTTNHNGIPPRPPHAPHALQRPPRRLPPQPHHPRLLHLPPRPRNLQPSPPRVPRPPTRPQKGLTRRSGPVLPQRRLPPCHRHVPQEAQLCQP